jgi:hypothetical protein
MRMALFAVSTMMLMSGATGAFAATQCSGDFTKVDGAWVAEPNCERSAAHAIARSEHEQIARDPNGRNQISREEFCLGNEDIRTDDYCAPFKD